MEVVEINENIKELKQENERLKKSYEDFNKAIKDKDFVAMTNIASLYIHLYSYKYGYVYTIEHFGICPECLKTDGCLHIGRDEWFICHEHKVKWYVGSNLFSSWREMKDEQFQENYELLSGYTEIEPIHLIEFRPGCQKKIDEMVFPQEEPIEVIF